MVPFGAFKTTPISRHEQYDLIRRKAMLTKLHSMSEASEISLIKNLNASSLIIDYTVIVVSDEGLDKKLLLRSDGTSVYMTQDLGTAVQRISDNENVKGMIYTVGNEQDYHFNVLFKILKKLGYDWASYLSHLSYGMVDLPSGKMKSREGTVVDADDLIFELIQNVKETTENLDKFKSNKEIEFQSIDMSKAKKIIGFKKTKLKIGLKKTIDWFKDNI